MAIPFLGVLTAATVYGTVKATKSPKMPEIPTIIPPVITEQVPTTSEEVEAVKEEEKKKLTQGRKKSKGTILTSERGILEPANIGLKTLLGQ